MTITLYGKRYCKVILSQLLYAPCGLKVIIVRITHFKVSGFKRLALSNIRQFSATFTDPFQVILGTNGSGKTSILRELHPLPADAADYTAGGYKEVTIDHDGSTYLIKSICKSTMKHEFWRDGVQMNQGGTATVQRELVKRFFGLTPQLIELMNGGVLFQNMSAVKRRELFTELCPVDLSYAIGVFNRLKGSYRDTIGARKHVEARLAAETVKLMTPEEAELLDQQITVIQSELEILTANRDLQVKQEGLSDGLLTELLNRLGGVSSGVVKIGGAVEHPPMLNDAIGYREQTRSRIEMTHALRNKALAEFGELEKALAEAMRVDGLSKERVEESLAKNREKLLTLAVDTRFVYPEQTKMAIEQTEEITLRLSELLSAMPDSTQIEMGFDRSAKELRQSQIESCKNAILQQEHYLGHVTRRLESIETAKQETCPSCSFKYIPGVSIDEPERLRLQRLEREAKIKDEEEKLKILLREDELQIQYDNTLHEIRSVVRSYPLLKGLWNYFADRGFPSCPPRSLIPVIHQWKVGLLAAYERQMVEIDIRNQEDMLRRLKALDGSSAGMLSERSKTLQDDIERYTQDLVALEKELSQLRDLVASLEALSESDIRLRDHIKSIDQTVKQQVTALRNSAIERCIEGHHLQLGTLARRQNEQKVIAGVIGDLERSLENLKRHEKAYAVLLDELSPTEGLIAEQLSGFIACFTEKLNHILQRIWTYPLKVLPCGLSDGDLDYRFPLEVADEQNVAPDVSCGSEAQRDVIDFAFKLTVGLYLNHTDWPLYLDELGASFDETHRERILAFVREYVDLGKAPQCFYISHYVSTHAAMALSLIHI